MNYLDGVIREKLIQRSVGTRDTQSLCASRATFWRAAQDAANLHADPAQSLNVHRADEPRTDDSCAGVSGPPHEVSPVTRV